MLMIMYLTGGCQQRKDIQVVDKETDEKKKLNIH